MKGIRRRLLRGILVAVALTGVVCPVRAQTVQTAYWLGGGPFYWFDPNDLFGGCTNWDICPNVPSPAHNYNIFITAPSSSVVLNGVADVLNLTLASGNSLTATSTSELNFGNDATVGTYNLTLNNAGNIELANQSSLNVLNVTGSTTSLTISGTGTITMDTASNGMNAIGSTGSLLVNQSAIQGQGQLGLGLQVVNQGTINANVSGGTLSVQPDIAGMVNSGILEASNGGTLDLISGFSNVPFNNTGGTIQALNGSTVLNQAGVISGGTLSTAGTGIIQTVGANPTLMNVTNTGTYQVLNGGATTLQGTINNTGSFLVGASAGGAQLFINGTVTLSGGGTLTMVDSANPVNAIESLVSGSQLINQQTIQGAGTIGNANLTVVNQGMINANITAHPLGFADAGFTNQGLVKATNGASLNIFSPTFNNQGTLQVDSGSTITFINTNVLTNFNSATNTLTGGSYLIAGTLDFPSTNVAINTNAANIVLNGAGSQIVSLLNPDALAGLATNAAGSSFTITNGRNFTTAGDFQNSGTVTIGNNSTFLTGANATNNYTQNGGASLTDIQNGGQFATSTYTMNGGTTQIETGGKLTASNFNFNGGTLTVNGTLDPLLLAICPSCTLAGNGTVIAGITSSGTVNPGMLNPSLLSGMLAISGNYAQNSGGTLAIDLGGTGLDQFSVLDVTGNTALGGTVDFIALNGFAPVAGDDFTYLLFGGEFGNFSNIVFTNWTCPANDTCTNVLSGNKLTLEINGPASPVPEPDSFFSIAIGLISVGYIKRKMTARQ